MYYFINDPGHGWLRVPKTELRHLNIERKISSYSYQSKLHAYLEEDCDLKTFLDAKNIGTNGTWEEKQKAYKIFWDNHTKDKYSERAACRNYERYSTPSANTKGGGYSHK